MLQTDAVCPRALPPGPDEFLFPEYERSVRQAVGEFIRRSESSNRLPVLRVLTSVGGIVLPRGTYVNVAHFCKGANESVPSVSSH